MKKFFMFAMVTLLISSCQNDDASSTDSSFSMKAAGADYSGYPATVETVSGDITTNTTWTNDKVWEISGVVRVKSGATLTIQPGTYIKGKLLSPGVATGVLVITKTGRIDAQGTATAPIVFTSYKLLDGNAATSADTGDFGGVIILGDAVVNNGLINNVVEGLGDQLNVSDFYFGGTNNTHNAGALIYTRIEFAGRILDFSSGIEINGLTLAGVGSGTVLHHIQVSYARDDSFQFFGGTVNATHLVAFAGFDDNFDFELGYTGTITKAIALADSNSLHSFSGSSTPDSNGIEIDNNATGTATALITRPVLSQMSIIGVSSTIDADLYEQAIHIRRLGKVSLTNVTVTGYNRGINWESPSLPSASTWSALSIHGFDNPVLPLGTTLGLGSTTSIATPAIKWLLIQPFFNDAPLNFIGTTGAFKTEPNWTANWTKFTNF